MGKYAILMVFTLSVMLGILLPNVYRLGIRASENYANYATATQAHHNSVSGANIALSKFYFDTTWRAGLSNMSLAGGAYNVTVSKYGTNQVKIVSIGNFQKTLDTVSVLLQPGAFSSYAYYSKVEGNIQWATGDTVWGPFHTQDLMNVNGTPVFKGRVSAKQGTNPKNSGAQFLGGYFTGENVDLPLDFHDADNAAKAGGKVFASGDLWLTFSGSSVIWKTSANGATTTTPLATFAPNGVIEATKGNIHIKGTLSGSVTIVAEGSSTSQGNVYIDNDVNYTADPRVTPTSKDMLGILVDNSVIITDSSGKNNNDGVTIQASILCRNGGLTAENYSTRGLDGSINLLGGVIQYQRGAVGVLGNNGAISNGFKKNYRYDTRMYLSAPPYFPFTGKYQLISWVE
jgi:hypothetical protein